MQRHVTQSHANTLEVSRNLHSSVSPLGLLILEDQIVLALRVHPVVKTFIDQPIGYHHGNKI